MLSELKRIVFEEEYKEAATPEAEKIMDEALSLILSIAPPLMAAQKLPRPERRNVVVNRALIVINQGQADMVHISDAITEVCLRFGIQASCADRNEHQQRITNGVLKYMAEAEFVIGDLTNASHDVFYALGYAGALKIHPILFCEAGTELPFDLTVHDVSEYKTLSDLKTLLHDRLEAILGRKVA